MARYLLFICAVLITAALFTSCASKPAGSGETSEQIPQISKTASPVPETAELPESTAQNDVTTAAEENIPGSTKVLYIYTFKSSPNYYWASAEPPDTEQNPNFVPTGTYPCKTDGAECVSNAGSKLLISDGDWYICDALSGACEELKLNFAKDDYSSIRFTYDSETGEFSGLCVTDKNNKMAFYDLESNTFKTGFIYADIHTETYAGHFIAANPLADRDSGKNDVYNIKSGELIGSADGWMSGKCYGGTVYFMLYDFGADMSHFHVYNSDMKQLSDEYYYLGSVTSDGNLLLIGYQPDDSTGRKPAAYYQIMDRDGNPVYKSRDYDGAFYVWRDYICVNDSGMLKLINKDGGDVALFREWNDKMMFHWMLGGYYQKGTYYGDDYPQSFYKINDGSGIPVYEKQEFPDTLPAALYLICEDTSIEYGNEGSGMEFYYVPETGESGMITTIGVGGYAKPVLYLYPEQEYEISVTFAHPEYLTVTYPAYPENGWQVTVSPDGTITDERGRSYYALYWEESGYIQTDFLTGFCVKGDAAAPFLEEKLDMLGFTQREANEFIMYWLPVLQENGVSLVYFELTGSRQVYNRLNIIPTPDSLLRVAIHIKNIDAPVDIAEQVLPSFERSGFAAVEWGGVIY